MKKVIIRIVGAICVLASLAMVFFPTWIQIDGVKRKDFREYRTQTIDDLEMIRDTLISNYEMDKYYEDVEGFDMTLEEDLDDNDLPSTKGGIKNRFRKAEALIEEMINDKISLEEVFTLSVAAPQFIEDTENLLETEKCADIVFSTSEYVYYDQAEDAVDAAIEYEFVFYIIIAFFVFLIVLALATVVTQTLNKFKFFKFIFWSILALTVAGICVVLPVASGGIAEMFSATDALEDISLKITAMPFIAIALATVPIVLDIIIFIKSKKEKRGA